MTRQLNSAQRKIILERDEYTCQVCGHVGTEDSVSRGMEVHHIMPRVLGGTNEPDNLTTLCESCHKQRDICAGTRKAASMNQPTLPPLVLDLPPIYHRRLRELAEVYGTNQRETLMVAINRMYQQECR